MSTWVQRWKIDLSTAIGGAMQRIVIRWCDPLETKVNVEHISVWCAADVFIASSRQRSSGENHFALHVMALNATFSSPSSCVAFFNHPAERLCVNRSTENEKIAYERALLPLVVIKRMRRLVMRLTLTNGRLTAPHHHPRHDYNNPK